MASGRRGNCLNVCTLVEDKKDDLAGLLGMERKERGKPIVD